MKILMILPRFPYPLEKGDKLRAFNQIKILSKYHDVFLFCITSKKPTIKAIQALTPHCNEICWYRSGRFEILINIFHAVFTRKPLQNSFFVFKNAKQKLQSFIDEIQPNHLFFQLVRMADYAECNTDIPKTLDYQDAFSLGMLRRSEYAKFPLKQLYGAEYKRLKHAETKAFDKFDHKMIISESDQTQINHPKRGEILIVKNGIDLDFFKFDPNVQKSADLLFVGNLSYPPNVQAVTILFDEIMPKLRQKNPSVKLLIAGANPPRKWFKYLSENIEISANPKDIRKAYYRAKIFVAPMMSGTGLQNKLLEAMAMKLPCITTPLANSGLGATPETNVLIAETADDFVKQIVRLQHDPNVYHHISEHAFNFVNTFSWKNELEKWSCKISEPPVK